MSKIEYPKAEIIGKTFEVIPNKGFCDGCYFQKKETCPPRALRQCVAAGNILRLVEPNNK